MITLSMTDQEMEKELLRVYHENRPSIGQEYMKRIKKMGYPSSFSLIIPFVDKASNQKHYFIELVNPNKTFETTLVCELEGDDGRLFVNVTYSWYSSNRVIEGGISIITEHLLQRYAQRLHLSYKLTDILKRVINSSFGMVIIYHDKEKKRVVWATKFGLFLATYENVDNDGNICRETYRTFISPDLMQGSQKESYNKIREFIIAQQRQMATIKLRNDKQIDEFIDSHHRVFVLAERLASPIYAQYFETYKEEMQL